VIEVVTSQMITYGSMALLQDIPEVIVAVYVFDVSCLNNAHHIVYKIFKSVYCLLIT